MGHYEDDGFNIMTGEYERGYPMGPPGWNPREATMTDLSADVRIVAEWLGTAWADPGCLAQLDAKSNYLLFAHFINIILDRLAMVPKCVGVVHKYEAHEIGKWGWECYINSTPSGLGTAPTRAEAIVRATAAWRRAEGGSDA